MTVQAPRPAVVDDCDEILRLANLMWMAEGFSAEPGEWETNFREVFTSKIGSQDLRIFVVDDPDQPGRLIACGAAWVQRVLPAFWVTNGLVGFLQWFSVQPEWRGQGIGTTLLEVSTKWLRERGCTRIQLHSAPDAIKLYERHGFELNRDFENMWWRPT